MAAIPPSISLPNPGGIDFSSIITALVSAAEIPVVALNQEISGEQNSISALGDIGGALTQLQTSLAVFQNSATQPPVAASVQSGAPFTASISGSPAPGNYEITVNALAQAQITASQGYSSASDPIGTGTITLTVGGAAHTLTIDSTNDTLQGAADAINAANLGVTAQVVNTGLPSTPYRLELLASKSGAANAFQVSASLSGGDALDFASPGVSAVDYSAITGTANSSANGPVISGNYSGLESQGFHFTVAQGGTIGVDPVSISWSDDAGETGVISLPSTYTAGTPITIADGLNVSFAATGGTLNTGDAFSFGAFNPTIQNAQNAQLQIGNQSVSSSSNEITGAIPGVTLDLTGAGGPYSVQVSEDTATESRDVESFVSAYNSVISKIQSYTQAQPGQPEPALDANGAVEALGLGLSSALTTIDLSKLGITIDNNQAQDNNGRLVFSSDDFAAALASDPAGVHAATAQLYVALNGLVTDGLQSNSGVIDAETASYNQQITQQTAQLKNMQQEVNQEQQQLQLEFANLQSIIYQYNSISTLLNQANSSSSANGNSSSGL